MEEATRKDLQQKAEDLYADLKANFPNIEMELAAVTELVYSVAGDTPLKEVIYKSLMTGATLLHEKYSKANSATEDLLTTLVKK